MKELSGSAEITTEATPTACFDLVAAVDRYPSWDRDAIPKVEVLEVGSDGEPKRVRTAVHVAVGPITRDFDLMMDVEPSEHDAVCLSRVPNEAGDPERFEVVWRIAEGPPTRLRIELTATLEVPRLVPLGGIGDRLAQRVRGGGQTRARGLEREGLGEQLVGAPAGGVVVGDRHHDHLLGAVVAGQLARAPPRTVSGEPMIPRRPAAAGAPRRRASPRGAGTRSPSPAAAPGSARPRRSSVSVIRLLAARCWASSSVGGAQHPRGHRGPRRLQARARAAKRSR